MTDVAPTPRTNVSAARKRRIWEARNGICAWCLKPVEMFGQGVRYDHHIPLYQGGADTDDNMRPLHTVPCDKAKTALDQKVHAKIERIRLKRDRDRREARRAKRRKLKSRGFSTTLSRGLNGLVSRRDGADKGGSNA